MPLTTIVTAKEAEESYQPILLVDLIWRERQFGMLNGDEELVEHLCARSLDPDETGIPAIRFSDGTIYQGRILNHQFAAWQVLTSNGIGMAPSVDLEIADPDLDLWNTYEGISGPGFRGAHIRIRFAFADFSVSPPTFSNDTLLVFMGTVNQPRSTDNILRLNATSMLLMQYLTMPSIHIGKRCPWMHPETPAELDQAEDPTSAFYPCGRYMIRATPDSPLEEDDHSACTHTLADCVRLGRFIHGGDRSQVGQGGGTGRFGGSVYSYSVPKEYSGHMFVEGRGEMRGYNADVSSKYSRYVPLIYGFGWVDCPVMTVFGDANYNRFECLVCYGDTNDTSVPLFGVVPDLADPALWEYIRERLQGALLTCNGHTFGMTQPDEAMTKLTENGFWLWVTRGQRDGTACRELGFVDNPDLARALRSPLGDPYGSMTVVYVAIIPDAAQSETLPQIRILAAGPKLLHGGNEITNSVVGGGVHIQGVVTPWVIEDALVNWGGWTEAELDMDAFATAATKASVFIGFTDAQGNQHEAIQGHPLWKTNLVLQDPQSVHTVIQGLLNNCDGFLTIGKNGLKLVLRETLASQQPEAFDWANDEAKVGYPSMLVTGERADGFFAYVFSESNIKLDENGYSTLHIDEHAFEDSPNALGLTFSDEENMYRQDNLTVVDERDVQRTGIVIPAGFPMLGVPNFDQAYRACWRKLAQQSRGNPRYADPDVTRKYSTSGTWILTFTTTVRAVGLEPGMIIGVRSKRYNLGQNGAPPQAFRITEIKASPDFSELTITAWWHEDTWHLHAFGQQDEDKLSNPGAEHIARVPFIWQPYLVRVPDTDPWQAGEYTFGLRQRYAALSDDSIEVHLEITGYLPQNQPASPTMLVPYFSVDPYAVEGGGLVKGQVYLVAMTARSATGGNESQPQAPLHSVLIPPEADSARQKIVLPDVDFHGGEGYVLYAGTNAWNLSAQKTEVGTKQEPKQPGEFSLETIVLNQFGMPDSAAKQLLVRHRKVWHSGVWGQPIDMVGTNTFSIFSAGWQPHTLIGRVVSVLARATEQTDGQPLPVWNFMVVDNDEDTLTVGSPNGPVDLLAMGIQVNDALVMRAQAMMVSDPNDPNIINDGIVDAQWINGLSEPSQILTAVPYPHDLDWTILHIPVHPFREGDPIRIFGARTTDDTDSEINGSWTIMVIDPNTIAIQARMEHIYHAGTGFAQLIGLRAHEEIGRSLFVIRGPGAGKSYKIRENDLISIWIDGRFNPPLSSDPTNPSVFIIEDSAWATAPTQAPFKNPYSPADLTNRTVFTMNHLVTNAGAEMVRVQVDVVDQAGRTSPSGPWREIYVFGYPSTAINYEKAIFNVNNTKVNLDVCPHVLIKRPGTPFELTAKTKYEMESDFTATISVHHWNGSSLSEDITPIASITVPASTGLTDIVGVMETDPGWITPGVTLHMNDYLTVDVQASDEYADYRGAITLTLKWEIEE